MLPDPLGEYTTPRAVQTAGNRVNMICGAVVHSLLEHSMPSPKFRVGESVRSAQGSRNVPGGVYSVTKRLPDRGSEREYRIKSASEPHERVVRESEISRA
jgi:hypothetical protein